MFTEGGHIGKGCHLLHLHLCAEGVFYEVLQADLVERVERQVGFQMLVGHHLHLLLPLQKGLHQAVFLGLGFCCLAFLLRSVGARSQNVLELEALQFV